MLVWSKSMTWHLNADCWRQGIKFIPLAVKSLGGLHELSVAKIWKLTAADWSDGLADWSGWEGIPVPPRTTFENIAGPRKLRPFREMYTRDSSCRYWQPGVTYSLFAFLFKCMLFWYTIHHPILLDENKVPSRKYPRIRHQKDNNSVFFNVCQTALLSSAQMTYFCPQTQHVKQSSVSTRVWGRGLVPSPGMRWSKGGYVPLVEYDPGKDVVLEQDEVLGLDVA